MLEEFLLWNFSGNFSTRFIGRNGGEEKGVVEGFYWEAGGGGWGKPWKLGVFRALGVVLAGFCRTKKPETKG